MVFDWGQLREGMLVGGAMGDMGLILSVEKKKPEDNGLDVVRVTMLKSQNGVAEVIDSGWRPARLTSWWYEVE